MNSYLSHTEHRFSRPPWLIDSKIISSIAPGTSTISRKHYKLHPNASSIVIANVFDITMIFKSTSTIYKSLLQSIYL